MQPEIGEAFVGAYLRIVKKCPIVQYNIHDPHVGGQGEIDVLGLDYETKALYACEVATHLGGTLYSKTVAGRKVDYTIKTIDAKLSHDRTFIARAFPEFGSPVFMLWSPYIPKGHKTQAIEAMTSSWPGPGRFLAMINGAYADAMRKLIELASRETKQRGEIFYRTLQILTHIRGADGHRVRLRLE